MNGQNAYYIVTRGATVGSCQFHGPTCYVDLQLNSLFTLHFYNINVPEIYFIICHILQLQVS